MTDGINQWVEETKTWKACFETSVVQQRNEACEGRRSSRRSADEPSSALEEDLEVIGLRRNIRNGLIQKMSEDGLNLKSEQLYSSVSVES